MRKIFKNSGRDLSRGEAEEDIWKRISESGEKVFVLDDDRDFLCELSTALQFEGFNVVAYSDSDDVLGKVRYCKPDAVVLDLHMRPMDGFQLASALKGADDTHAIPLFAMSGYYKVADHWFVSFDDFEVCLTKDMDVVAIAAELRRVIMAKKARVCNVNIDGKAAKRKKELHS